jgi:hypothetical protein
MKTAMPTALMPTRMLIVTSSEGIANRMVQNPTYSYVGQNPQPTQNNQSILGYSATQNYEFGVLL